MRPSRPGARVPPCRGERRPGGLARGGVKRFSKAKGFGFIEDLDGGGEFLVHYTEITGDGFRMLWEDKEVEGVG